MRPNNAGFKIIFHFGKQLYELLYGDICRIQKATRKQRENQRSILTEPMTRRRSIAGWVQPAILRSLPGANFIWSYVLTETNCSFRACMPEARNKSWPAIFFPLNLDELYPSANSPSKIDEVRSMPLIY